jgi:hypothetical protein
MPSCSKIRRIWWVTFHIDGFCTLRTVALRRPIFKQKKGSATISLGLNYCSMGSSHSLSYDTVPLSHSLTNTSLARQEGKSARKSLYSPSFNQIHSYCQSLVVFFFVFKLWKIYFTKVVALPQRASQILKRSTAILIWGLRLPQEGTRLIVRHLYDKLFS